MTRFLFLSCFALAALAERPISHADYDSWKSIVMPRVSDNGRFLIYGLFPQAGDGVAVIRDLNTDAEIRQPAGERPQPPPPDYSGSEEAEPQAPGLTSAFTSDNAFAIYRTHPAAAATAQARADKKKPAEMPQGDLVIVNLSTGQISRVSGVKSFAVPESSPERVVYLKSSGELMVRSLRDQPERAFPDAVEYKISGDGKTLVYTGKKGAFAVALPQGEVTTLAEGESKYARLTQDESSQHFAFARANELYLWSPGMPAASAVVKDISPNAPLGFSADGTRLFFGMPPKQTAAAATANGAVFDLWHYQDDYIQPMQQVRAKSERERSDRAVYLTAEKKVVPLGGGQLTKVTPAHHGSVAIGIDDRPYRRVREYDTGYSDFYLVDTKSGDRKLIQKELASTPTLSPDGRYAAGFSNQNWICWDTKTGASRNLTALTGRNFYREDNDSPQTASSYGAPVWTRDGKFLLIPDRHDIWQFAPDGSMARNLTDGLGRRENLELRIVSLDNDPKQPGIDPTAPLILRAENLKTRDSGFYRDSLDPAARPEKLSMGAANHRVLAKAKKADVYLFTASNFDVFPDIQITNSAMKDFRKVTNANPQKADLAWGTSELIEYRNADGKLLSAALFKPPGFDPSKKYPLLVYIYEKLSNTVHNFVDPAPSHRINASYYTSNGYVVLMPDIVYTIGYPGASALKCVLPATQHVMNLGFIDPERVGIQGHSWGGYQIAYMITQSNLFRAAAPGALVANMISAYDGIRWGPGIPRQFQYEKTQSRIGGTPWQYPMRFIENSPVFMADRVQTPVLMLHNDADDAVPWYQGIEFFLALRRLGKEVYFFNYNGEPHGVRKRPNQKDYTVRMQQFFDYYLKGDAKPVWMERGRAYVEKTTAATVEAPTDRP